MQFTDRSSSLETAKDPEMLAETQESPISRRRRSPDVSRASTPYPDQRYPGSDASRIYGMRENPPHQGRGEDLSDDEAMRGFGSRPGGKRVKLCGNCRNVMKRSSRMILSIPAAVALIGLGVAFMTGYGLAKNFYHPPWFLEFALPALYYVGSLFVGVGVLFFFIRERVWYCTSCREIQKR